MDSFSDPDDLRDRAEVSFHDEVRQLPADKFESVAEELDSHAVVGITNDDGDILLMNDGSHGWTLVAFPVEHGEDWMTVAQQKSEALLDDTVVVEKVEFIRRVVFQSVDDDSQRTTMYNVVFRASADDSVSVEKTVEKDDLSLRWFDGVPDGQEGDVADDIRYFLRN
ncbi:hypothetical protein ACH9L7_19735 (plasmid) [Haloferax sp. S1W]|uniref:hypothetical protein n=1 Tax=unclassified Haloferax TaxID=2625095 RepID=UPI000737CD05|nr:hypothetical protein [Haloferax sp. Q22]